MKTKIFLRTDIFCMIIGILYLSAFPEALRAEKWLFYSHINGVSYYDRDSIKKISKNTISLWTEMNYSQEVRNFLRSVDIENEKRQKKQGKKEPFKKSILKDIKYDRMLMEINCDTGSYKYIRLIQYNESGENINDSDKTPAYREYEATQNRTFNDLEPDAPGLKLFNDTCSYAFKREE